MCVLQIEFSLLKYTISLWQINPTISDRFNLSEAYCVFQQGELYLKNTHISPYENAGYVKVDPLRDRKLLLNKKELRKLSESVSRKGLTIVPTKMFINEKGLCKVEICLSQGKKNYDKRESLKEKDMKKRVNNLDY